VRIATLAAAAAAAVLLAGCGGAAQDNGSAPAANGSAQAPAAAPGTPASAPVAAAVLTAEGFGPLRIGMSRAELVEALGEDRNPEAVGGPDPERCDEFRPARAPEGMLVMIEEGRLSRISLVAGAKVATDRGLTVGAAAAAVRDAYGNALKSGPHKYEGRPAAYFTVWATKGPKADQYEAAPTARGILYEVGTTGLVKAIHAGGPSIQYVEGCA
jgi:hypothetical protein